MIAISVYFFGIGALVLSDLLVTRFFSPEEIAAWAETRALIGILGVTVTLGLDMVFVRSPQSSGRLLRLVAVQVPILALIVGMGAHALGYLSSYMVGVSLALGSGLILVQGQYFRAHSLFHASQIVQQGWKLCALIGIGAIIFQPDRLKVSLDVLVAAIMLGCALINWISVFRWPSSPFILQKPESNGALYAIGLRFLLTSFVFALAIYGEQLIVNGVGSSREAAIYFTHATYFLLPVTVVTGYLGFRIGPWLRDNHDRFIALLSAKRVHINLLAIIYVALMQAVGWIGWQIIDPVVGEPDVLIQLAFFCSAVARTFYTIPSGYNGVFGRPAQHDLLIALQLALLALISMLLFVFLGRIELVYFVAGLGALNWIARTIIANHVMGRIIRGRTAKTSMTGPGSWR